MKRIVGYLVFSFIVSISAGAWGYEDHDCIQCNDREGSETQLHVSMPDQQSTVHGQLLGCLDCHQDVKDIRNIRIGSTRKVDCQGCHEQNNLHAQDGSVTCVDCHTPHHIYRVIDSRSSVHWKNLRSTCGKCHPEESQHRNILSTLSMLHIASHPKQDFSKIFDAGMCVGCHQGRAAHGEDELVNDQDCYKCHMKLAKYSLILGYIHPGTEWHSKLVQTFAGYIYLVAALTLAGVFVRRFVNFVRKRKLKQ